MEPMQNDNDITRAKQIALYLELEQETHEEIEGFIEKLESYYKKIVVIFSEENDD